MQPSESTSARILWLIVMLLVGTLVLAACGGGGEETSDSGDIATLETNTPTEQAADSDVTTAEAAADEEEITFEDAQLAFSQCMRDNGFPQWPDPDPNSEQDVRGGFGNVDLDALGIDRSAEGFRSTIDVCRENFEGVAGGRQDLDPEQQAELEDNVLALFACVRGNAGWEDLPDPDFSGEGLGLRELFQSGDVNPQELRPLLQACQQELGIEGFGGNGRGGARPPAPARGADA
ncbi:MAG: hypothetical protein P8N50_09485 [Actinomycetota bacterium]|nr:hypothetical protein [Actinomycetota bacterium]